ncbi:MAG: sulfatase-like hydrolase/transferase [Chloroflexota bacterium]
MKKTKWYEHLTPLFLAIFPILSLALENIEFIHLSSLFRSLLISVIAAAIFYLLLSLILKDKRKSGILAGLLVFMLLTYGNVFLFLEGRLGDAVDHRTLLGIYALLYFLVGVLIISKVQNAKDYNLAILTGGLVIVLYLLISIGFYEYKVYRSEVSAQESSDPFSSSLTEEDISNLPDIYLILLDGHTRSDVLREDYGYDNSQFIMGLEDLGFWVADCSISNYPATNFSTAALFEMDYMHNVYEEYDNLVFPPLNNTAVFRILGDHNYSTVTFHNFVFEHFNLKDDIRFAKEDLQFGSINEFEKMVVDTSILRILMDMEELFPDSWVRVFTDNFYLTHYRDTLFALETLPTLPEMDERKFVYAHLMVTHDPFVFMPDGSFNTSKKLTKTDYRNSVEFIDNALPKIVEEIINQSEEPPIIIIMGDHGATIKGNPIDKRVSILFSVYLQGEEAEGFYDEISLVNVFRLIFNDLFDADLDLIEDQSYEIWNTSELGNIEEQITTSCNP